MAKKITISALCAAMSLVCMLLTAVITTNTLFLLCLATVFLPLSLIKCGRTYAVCTLVAAAALVFIFGPDKLLCLEFALLAAYALCKSLIEKIGILWVEWCIKIAVYFAAASAFFAIFIKGFSIWLIVAGAAVFVVYDIVLSITITYLSKKIKNI